MHKRTDCCGDSGAHSSLRRDHNKAVISLVHFTSPFIINMVSFWIRSTTFPEPMASTTNVHTFLCIHFTIYNPFNMGMTTALTTLRNNNNAVLFYSVRYVYIIARFKEVVMKWHNDRRTVRASLQRASKIVDETTSWNIGLVVSNVWDFVVGSVVSRKDKSGTWRE